MNKLKKISIITIILCSFLVTSHAATATIDVSAARLRESANTTSNILTNIYKGEKVEILEQNGDWYKVKYGNNTGYLKKDLIKVSEDSKKDDSTVSTSTYTNVDTENVDSSKITLNSTTKVRFSPNMISSTIGQFESGIEITKKSEIGNWVQVTDGLVTGWILKTKVTANQAPQVNTEDFENTETPVENKKEEEPKKEEKPKEPEEPKKEETPATKPVSVNKTGVVNVETAKVRKSASSTAKIVGFLDYNDKVTITEEEGDWYKFTEKDVSGYVHKTLITVDGEENISSRGTEEERVDPTTVNNSTNENVNNALENNNQNNGQNVVDYAKQYLGYPYVVGGKNPTTGFDCSGFTRYVFLNYGYSLGATAAGQNNLGTEISKENLQPGDLLLFYDEAMTKIGHTGIYISNGDFIHAANPTRGVVIDNVNTNSYYRERFIVARRIVE